MKTKTTKKNALPVKDAFKILTFIFAAIMISSCSNKYVFPTSEVLPAAEAEVKINKNKSNNYEIELEIDNMASPKRLTPARSHYVAWMETASHGNVNLGNLRISSKNKAELTTMTPYKPIRIFITAEDSQKIMRPSTQVVLSTDVDVD
jgi:hypothetical protein